jgi:hypothetical protein
VPKPLAVAIAALLATVALPAVAPAALPPIGLNVPGGAAAASSVAQVRASGAKYVRAFLIWNGQATPGPDVYAGWDSVVNGYGAAGVKPVIVVSGLGAPPADDGAYASFVGALAARYGAKVAAWEIWNEEDAKIWWGSAYDDAGSTNAAAYAALLRVVYPAVHPYAPVFVGGLTGNNYKFMEQLYGALGGSSTGAFDGVAAHTDTGCLLASPYAFLRNPDGRVSEFSFLGLREVHATMEAHGDGAKPIWLTEVGWSTSTAVCDVGVWAGQKAAGVSEADQARFLAEAWHCLADYPYVTNALWFTLQDTSSASIEQLGLLRRDGSAKPSWAAFQAVAAGHDAAAGETCGDFTPPSIEVGTPRDGARYVDRLPITVTASDPSGVGRITLQADGRTIRNFTTGKTRAAGFPPTLSTTGVKPFTWYGASKLSRGRHTITAIAVDGNRNTATRRFTVVKVPLSQMTSATRFATFALSGRGTRRTLKVRVTAARAASGAFRAVHKVRIVFQKRVGRRWVSAHTYRYSAKAPIVVHVGLERARWRVFATFAKRAPFLASRSKVLRFAVR